MKKESVLFIAVSFLVFIYLILRAIYLPLLHDEIATFYFYVQPGKFFPPNASWDANNHFLNSILAHFSYRIFGENSFALRLPNLLAALLFFLSVFKLSQELKNETTKAILRYSFLFGLPFLEYFGLCRGYGLSMACLMFVIINFVQYQNDFSIGSLVKIFLWMHIMLSANLSLLITALIILIIIPLLTLIQTETVSKKIKHFVIWICLGVIPFVGWLLLSFEYKKRGLLYEGYHDSFYLNSFKTIVPVITGRINNSLTEIIISIVLLGVAILFLLANRKTKIFSQVFKTGNFTTFLLFGNIFSSILMANLLKVNYPSERIGVYWWPFIIISLVFLIDEIFMTQSNIKTWLLLIPTGIALNSFSNVGFNNTSAYTPHGLLPIGYYDTVMKSNFKNQSDIHIGSDITREFVWSWNNLKAGGKLNACETDFPECDYEFVIADSIQHKNALKKYTLLLSDPFSNYSLYKYKEEIVYKSLIKKENINSNGPTEQEFYTLIEGEAKELINKRIRVKLIGELQNGGRNFNSIIQISASNNNGETILYQRLMLNALHTKWKSGDKLNHSMIVSKFPNDAKHFNICIWNMDKKPFELRNVSVQIDTVTKTLSSQ